MGKLFLKTNENISFGFKCGVLSGISTVSSEEVFRVNAVDGSNGLELGKMALRQCGRACVVCGGLLHERPKRCMCFDCSARYRCFRVAYFSFADLYVECVDFNQSAGAT